MPNNPNKLSQFWQELKRRKVLRVITVYAAVAFVILQLVEILAPSLRLPEWTMNLILVLLIVGFIIAVILSWIYDVHPEGGIVKTEPAEKVKAENMPKSSNSWRIASYISFVVIVGLIVLNIIPRANNNKEILDKSIAVLPFRNDSPEQTEMYFIDGTMESILDNLCKVKDLRVVSRTSVEQYRDNPKPISTVGEEMNVSYVIEGSGLKHGDNIRLTIQLIDAKHDQHIWSNTYNRKTKEIFELQSEIAQLVAAEIEAVITPEEKQLIERIPTANITAYDLYWRGREEHTKYWTDHTKFWDALDRAVHYYKEALEYDSTYAEAYSGLASTYISKYRNSFLSEVYLDSVLMFSNKALKYNPNLSEAYQTKGYFYGLTGKRDQAYKEYNKAVIVNPNDGYNYLDIGLLYSGEDAILCIENIDKAISLERGALLPGMLRYIGNELANSGFLEAAMSYYEDALIIDDDSASYFRGLAGIRGLAGDYSNQLKYSLLAYGMAPHRPDILNSVLNAYQLLGQFEQSLQFCYKLIDRLNEMRRLEIGLYHRFGLTFSKTGNYELADFYFKQEVEYSDSIINNELWGDPYYAYYNRAGVYAYQGKKKEALGDLTRFSQRHRFYLGMVTLINNDPLFDNIRNEPEFQQIVREVEGKYQAEHERVRQWLEENNML